MTEESQDKQELIVEAPIKVKGENGENLQEIKLSWAGKLFFAGAAAFIMGRGAQSHVKLPIKVRGTPEQMQAVIDAIVSSKEFRKEIDRPGATIDSVVNKLRLRNLTKQRFQQLDRAQISPVHVFQHNHQRLQFSRFDNELSYIL